MEPFIAYYLSDHDNFGTNFLGITFRLPIEPKTYNRLVNEKCSRLPLVETDIVKIGWIRIPTCYFKSYL